MKYCIFQSKTQEIFFKQRKPCSIGEEVSFRSNHHDYVRLYCWYDQMTKGVAKIGTNPEEGQRVENKERFTKRNSGDILLSQ